MGTSPRRFSAVVGAVIATLMSGCAGGESGSNLPVARSPLTQRAALQYPYLNTNPSPSCAWSIVPSTSSTQGFQALYGVEATSNSDAWSVGEGSGAKTLALHWNGATWTHYSTPNPTTNNNVYFNSVAEVAPNDVWAVGEYTDNNHIEQTLAEHWDGVRWTIVPTPPTPQGDSGRGLESIKTISHSNAWAVGYEDGIGGFATLIEHWNGSTWTRVPSPNVQGGDDLTSLAVVTASNIWASGTGHGPTGAVYHYDGTTWTVAHTSTTEHIKALAAASATELFDVGYYINSRALTYAEEYNGSSWTHQATPNSGPDGIYLEAAAAVGTNEVFAVGSQGGNTVPVTPFAMMWNGTSWVLSQPLADGSSNLYGVTAIPGTKDAFAVGLSQNNGNSQTLIERAHCF